MVYSTISHVDKHERCEALYKRYMSMLEERSAGKAWVLACELKFLQFPYTPPNLRRFSMNASNPTNVSSIHEHK